MEKLFKYNSETLDFEVVNTVKYKVYFVGSLLLFFILLSSFISTSYSAKKENIKYVETEITINTRDTIQLKQDIFKEIDRLPFRFKSVIKAQFLVESSHFTSALVVENKNLFGIRLPKNRTTLAIGENLSHAVYKTYEDSVMDRLLYDALYMKDLSEEQYYSYLDRVYARAGNNYSKMLKSVILSNSL